MPLTKRFLNKSGITSPISGANSNAGAWNNSAGNNTQNSNLDWSFKDREFTSAC